MPDHANEDPTRTSLSEPRHASIGKYTITSLIGAGGMGEVFLAHDDTLDRDVALKLLPRHLATDEDRKARLLREARAVARLSHPNIVTVYEVGEHENQPFIAMEHIEGHTLDRVLRTDGALSVERTTHLITQIADGLAKAHAAGVVHRDLKPSNILITPDDRAVILDFGLATMVGAEALTQEGSTIGTPLYMSPEQVDGKPTDHRSDLFSLGSIFYELLTGRPPFQREHPTATLSAITNTNPDPVSHQCPGVPPALCAIVMRLLEKDPQRRYAQAEDLSADLQSGAPSGARGAPRRILTVAAIGILFALLVLAARPFFSGNSATAQTDRPKLVVLPFEHLGPADQTIVAAAINEEITSRLAGLRGIGVISRTSASRYRASDKSINEIARELDVDYLLEGTLTWGAATDGPTPIRISTRLIRADDETQMWTQTYDRVLDDVFTVQTDIARAVVSALDLSLGAQTEDEDGNGLPTESLDAYGAFLRGQDYAAQPDTHIDIDKALMAVEMFDRSVAYDPQFALGWASLSSSHSALYFWGHDRNPDRLALAREAVQRATNINPDLPEAHIALGDIHRCLREFDTALKHLEIAEQRRPNDIRIMVARAGIFSRQGKHEAAAEQFTRALELSPKDSVVAHDLGEVYLMPRKFKLAERFYDRAISLAPDQVLGYVCQADNYWLWQGETEKARGVLEEMPAAMGTLAAEFWYFQGLYTQNYEDAIRRIDSAPHEVFACANCYTPRQMLTARAYDAMGKNDLARQSYEEARVVLERALAKAPDDDRIYSALGICYAGLGRKDDALRQAQHAVDLVPYEKDTYSGSKRLRDLAITLTAVGEHDQALDILERLLTTPSFITAPLLRLDPVWRPLHGNARFESLVAEHTPG